MKKWISEGHLTDQALELRAAGEATARELRAIDTHLESCPQCRAREAEWREMFLSLARLEPLEPSAVFDSKVMARVRRPVVATTPAPAWLPKLVRRLRPIAVGAATLWGGVVIGGSIWIGASVDVPVMALVAKSISYGTDIVWAGVLKIGAFLHLSGLGAAWTDATQAVPGPGVMSAVALLTAVSGLAIWTLYRVTGHQPSGMKAHV